MNQSTPRVAIIGGGAAGLTAARIFSRQQRKEVRIVLLEKDETVGGVWNYKRPHSALPPEGPPRPMYQNLRTNLPKEIMAYREFPWHSGVDSNESLLLVPENPLSFVTHQEVAQYLRAYCSHFHLEQFIQKGCCVNQLTRVPNSKSRIQPGDSSLQNGQVPTKSNLWNMIRLDWSTTTQPNEQFSDLFDAVIVCNGHYSAPAIPNLPGLTEFFLGRTLHSIAYDVAEPFAHQTVLCVGGRASGSDIAREISVTAKSVYLSDTAFVGSEPVKHDNITWVPKTTEILSDGRVALGPTTTGQKIEPIRVDTIIFCSGYDYSFPFINSSSNLSLNASNRRVQPLFDQLWHADHPNVAFLGIPHSVVPFPLFEFQAEAVARSWLDGSADILIGVQRLATSSARDAQSGGALAGRVPHDTHFLGSAQWDYCRRMAVYAGILNREVENYIATNESIYDHATLARKKGFLAAADVYRLICYQRNDEERSFAHSVHPAR